MRSVAGGQAVTATTGGFNPFGSQMAPPPASFQTPGTNAANPYASIAIDGPPGSAVLASGQMLSSSQVMPPARSANPFQSVYTTSATQQSAQSGANPFQSVVQTSGTQQSAQSGANPFQSVVQTSGTYQSVQSGAYQSATYQSAAYQSVGQQQSVSIRSGPLVVQQGSGVLSAQPPQDLFSSIDVNGDGVISRQELASAMQAPVRVP
jgi:hypothetical protein